ncbi:MAG: hypothetical protein ABIN18_07270 [Pseudomonadota bacterium]
MNGRATQIGFSQRIQLDWLEKTANLVLAGNNQEAVYNELNDFLRDKLSFGSQAPRSNREKTITILIKVWQTVPHEIKYLRDDGLKLLQRLPKEDHKAIHWGMVLAVYPFWGFVAAQTGRLLKLQGKAAAVQVQRRIREQYGERETVSRAARRVLSSFRDWNILHKTEIKGIYSQGKQIIIQDPRIIAWLFEAYLHSREAKSSTLKDLFNNLSLFPFILERVVPEKLISFSSRLELFRHGLDEDMILLNKAGNV